MGTDLHDSELKIMDVLWRKGKTSAKDICKELQESVGWSRTTVYTLITRCIKKGAIKREDPSFMCIATTTRENVQKSNTNELVEKLYDGSPFSLIASLLSDKKLLNKEERDELIQLIDDMQK